MTKLCMGCMNPLPEDTTVCAVCGFDPSQDQNPAHGLPITTSLQGHYIVGRMVGEFPDHLLYLAYDRQMKEPCLIQEFFPASIGRRDTIGGVQPLEGCSEFEEYADRFHGTMRVLARMRELPAVVPVYDIFEENGTVYSVSDYCEGMTLTKKIKLSGGRIPWPEARSIFMSLLTSLTQLSDAGICHLAICPDNILIGNDGKARLRNFSIPEAHRSGTDLVADLKVGYAAPEQYYADEEVGVPADVYAVAATIFRTVTGTEPPAGDNRAKNSDDLFMSAEVADELTQPVCVALFNALQVLPERRTATLAVLRDELSVAPKVTALVDEAAEDMADSAEQDSEEKKGGKGGLIAMLVISLALLLIAVGVIVFMLVDNLSGGNKQGDSGYGDGTGTTRPTYTTQQAGVGEAVVDEVVGQKYEDIRDMTFTGDMKMHFVGYKYEQGREDGEILEQYPAAGAAQSMGSPIYVVVNNPRANSTVQVPDLKGWSVAHAEEFLTKLGFAVEKYPYAQGEPKYEKDMVEVVEQAGKWKELGDKITLYISEKEPEPETAAIPDLTGWDAEYAQKTLEFLGFTVQVEYVTESAYENGSVDSVEGAGTQVPVGSVVILRVSQKSTYPDWWQ